MKRKNTTRRALFTSVLSLLLCVSMLVGATFAWFTDKVESGMNTIAAGNLDVELLADGEKVKADTPLFDDAKIWEPGVVVYENLQVSNVGTLALKYQLSLNFGSENDLNGHKLSEVLKVAVLDEPIDKNTTTRAQILEKATAAAAADQGKGALANFYRTGELEAKTNGPAFAVVVFWAPNDNEIDNLYNANNEQRTSDGEPLHIEFGVNLQATQKMSESDSFGPEYDSLASNWDGDTGEVPAENEDGVITITTGAELAALAEAVNNGTTYKDKTILLGANIDLGNKAWTPIGQNGDKNGFQGTFDGQGHTIYNLYVNQDSRAYQAAGLFGSARYATIKNFKIVNATINNLDATDDSSNGAAVVVGAAQFTTTIDNVDVENANVTGNRRVAAIAGYYVGTITNCDVKNVNLTATVDALSNGGYDNADKVGMIIAYSNGASTITNNTVTDGSINGYRDMGGIAGYATTSTLTDNTVNGLSVVVNNAHNYKSYDELADYDAGEIIGEGTADATNVATNVTFVMGIADGLSKNADGSYDVSNANGLATLNTMMRDGSAGKNVVINLTDDIDFSGKTWTPVDAHYEFKFSLKEFNGNGHTISNFTVNGQAMFTRLVSTSDITVKDVTFDKAAVTNSGINTAIIVGHTYTNLTLDNVDVKNSAVTGGYKVATLVGTVYDEDANKTVTLTVKNCDVDNCTVTTTSYDFMTCGMVAFVYESNADKVVFENSTISNVTLVNTNDGGYNYHAFVYYNDQDTNDCFNEAEGVTVTNCKFLSEEADGLYKDADGNFYIHNANGLMAMHEVLTPEDDSLAASYQLNRIPLADRSINIMADIDAAGLEWESVNIGTEWGDINGFTFNGNNHTIKNLTIKDNPDPNSGCGLFNGTPNNGTGTTTTFKDLTFDNVTVEGSDGYHVGVIWGECWGDLTLNNVNVVNSTVNGKCNVGGLVGRNNNNVKIEFVNCSVENTKVTSAGGGDNGGASAFLGMALKIGTSTNVELTFEGCAASGNTLTSAAGHQGGGVYTKAEWGNATWDAPTVVNDFTNYNSNN